MTAHVSMRKVMTAIIVVAALALPAGDALAGSKLFTFFNTTTTIRGTVETNQFANRDPFVAEVFSAGNECLRLTVTTQTADLEMTLVAPGGRVWQDDDSAGSLRPRIHAQTTVRGWHIVILSHFSGASVNSDFTMTMLRTSSGSCAPITPPRITVDSQADKQGSVGSSPQGGTDD